MAIRLNLYHEPIDARQPGVGYRAKKFSRRNWSKIPGWGAAILIVFGLATAAAWADVRSTQRVENYAKLTRMLDDVIQHGLPLDELDSGWGEEWLELEPLLQEAIENNPSGPMALKAHRAAAGIRADYPAVGLVSDVPWPEVRFGSAADLFLPSDQKYLSIARLDLSWDGGPWFEVGRYALSHYGPAEEPEPLDEILNPSLITPGHHLVALRARLRLYFADALTGSVEEEDRLRDIRAWQKIDRADLGLAPTHEETRHLGRFAVNLFEEWPDDYPVGIAAEEPDRDGFRIDRVTLVRVSLAPSELSSFTYDWPEAEGATPTEVRLPSPGRSGLDGVLVGFELQGIIEPARLPAPLAADISLAIPGDQTIDLAALIVPIVKSGGPPPAEPTEMIQDLFGEMNNFNNVVVEGARITTIQAGLFAPMWKELRSCEASGRFEGVLQVTPSRSVAAESLLTSYLTNEFSFPVEVEIIDAPARWISVGRY